MAFSNKAYNVLKSIALIWLPAAATLYFALAGGLGDPDATQVVGSIHGSGRGSRRSSGIFVQDLRDAV